MGKKPNFLGLGDGDWGGVVSADLFLRLHYALNLW